MLGIVGCVFIGVPLKSPTVFVSTKVATDNRHWKLFLDEVGLTLPILKLRPPLDISYPILMYLLFLRRLARCLILERLDD